MSNMVSEVNCTPISERSAEHTFISLVIPAFNEEQVIPSLLSRLNVVTNGLGCRIEIIFVDDGSTDNTAALLEDMCADKFDGKLLILSRNFGHQNAVTAGLARAKGNCVVIMDADLQDPPEVIIEMLKKWREGYDIVHGVRADRSSDGFLKKWTATLYYRILRLLSNVEMVHQAGDFRLIDQGPCSLITQLPERRRYLRGLFAWAGFKQTIVLHVRDRRAEGATKYTTKKMVQLALDGLISFSFFPLRMIFVIGLINLLFAFIGILYVLYMKMIVDDFVIGLAGLYVLFLALSGFVILSIGILAEFLGNVLQNVQGRPAVVIKSVKNFK